MPARKPQMVLIPHRVAVELAPDCPEKRSVAAEARRHFDLHFGASSERNLSFMHDLMAQAATAMAHPDPLAGPRVSDTYLLRLAQAAERLQQQLEQRWERAYQFARTMHYQRTGVRVGELFWPIEQQAAMAADSTPETRHSAGAPAQAAVETPHAPPQIAAPARPEAVAPETPAPAKSSNKQIKAVVRKLQEAGVERERCEQFRKQAHAQAWPAERLELELRRLLAA